VATRKWGREKLVNTTTTGFQQNADIAALAGGGFVVVWEDRSGADTVIRAQRYDALGNRAGGELTIASVAGADYVAPVVTALADGGFYVTYTQDTGSQQSILGRVYDGNGAFVRDQTVFGFVLQEDSDVARFGTGSIVVWTDGTSNDGDVRYRIFDANGAELKLDIIPLGGSQMEVKVAASPNGSSFTIVFTDVLSGDVYGVIGDVDGVDTFFQVSATTAGSQYAPAVTWLDDDRFVVAWIDGSGTGADPDFSIKARIFSSGGTALTGDILVNSTTFFDQSDPSITALPNGGFVVSWEDFSHVGGDSSGAAIRLQVFDGAGGKTGGETLVNTTTSQGQDDPSIAALADGRIVVTWTDGSQTGGDASGTAIRMQIIDPRDGIVTGTSAGETLYGHDLVNDEITGFAGDDILYGLRGDDALYGGEANDTLNGGIGADIMYGGTGNDTYVVDNADDEVSENPGEGTDTVQSSVTYTLAAEVEKLTLTGTAAINGTGNALNNTITGNSANNALKGGGGNDTLDGGTGADAMTGGAGNDLYVIENAGDSVVEAAGGGVDTVKSSITDTLDPEVEKLTLTGTAAIDGTGNGLANTITGNSANNILNGGSGDDTLNGAGGNDDLYGTAGLDSFLFNTALNAATNVDDIFDFSKIDDTILLSQSIFAAAGAIGTLAASAFVTGAAATTANHRIMYNSGTGAVLFDQDGTGAAAAKQFATLGTGLGLTNGDFKIVA
jgi:serralysin